MHHGLLAARLGPTAALSNVVDMNRHGRRDLLHGVVLVLGVPEMLLLMVDRLTVLLLLRLLLCLPLVIRNLLIAIIQNS